MFSIAVKTSIILAFCVLVHSKFELKILKTVIRCDKSIFTCAFWNNGTTITGEVTMHKELPTLNMDLQFYIKQRNSQKIQTLANVSVDYCKFIKNPYDDIFASLYWGLLHIGNRNRIFEKCPVPKVI